MVSQSHTEPGPAADIFCGKYSQNLSVAPQSADYPSYSPYNYTLNNPIRLVDPDGRKVWKPNVDENGSTSYTAEAGDNFETFRSQYGLSKESAAAIFKESGISTTEDVEVGTSISGESVKKVTGTDVLKLDFASSRTTEQRTLDHLIFSLDHSKQESYEMDPNDYFSNRGGNTYRGKGTIDVEGEKVCVYYDAVLGWNYKSENTPVTVGPTRIGSGGESTNAFIYQRSNGKGLNSIRIVAPNERINSLWKRLN